MKKTILTLAAAATLAVGGMTATPQPANAQWWVAPLILGSVAAGGVAVAAASSSYATSPAAYEPRGTIYVQPTATTACHTERQVMSDGLVRRVRVCG